MRRARDASMSESRSLTRSGRRSPVSESRFSSGSGSDSSGSSDSSRSNTPSPSRTANGRYSSHSMSHTQTDVDTSTSLTNTTIPVATDDDSAIHKKGNRLARHKHSPSQPSTVASAAFSPAKLISQIHTPSALQHISTHLSYASPCPSLSGELLRQALSRFLRCQVCAVSQVLVLYGCNAHMHDLTPEDDIPVQAGRLMYAALTQAEMILIDKHALGQV